MSAQKRNEQPALIGRLEEIKLFEERLALLQAGAGRRRFIHLYGTGGIGKTALLDRFQALCQERGIACATLSLEDRPYVKSLPPRQAEEYVLRVIAEGLADQDSGVMQQLLSQRAEAVRAAGEEDGPGEKEGASLGFPERLAEGLQKLAGERPVVIFIDMVEVASPALRSVIEQSLVARMAAAPRGMIVSASRADLSATWSLAHRDLFDKFHLPPLPKGDLENLCSANLGADAASKLWQSPELSKLLYEVGRGNPEATRFAAAFLGLLLGENEDIVGQGLSPEQKCRLYEHMYKEYLQGWAFYAIEADSWVGRAYEKAMPARCMEPALLEALFVELDVERRNPAETGQQAAQAFEDIGLAYWNPLGLYQLDPLPRRLLVKYMACADIESLKEATRKLADLYKARILQYEPSPTVAQDILEYLYQLHQLNKLSGNPEPAIETIILAEIERCLAVNSSPQVVDTLWRVMREDDEIAEAFGLSLTSKALAAVETHSARRAASGIEPEKKDREALIRNVRTGDCILFLGPGLTLGADYLECYRELAENLAKESNYGGAPTELAYVAEHYAATLGADRLAERVSKYVQEHSRPDTGSLDSIVSLPFRVIATTAVDTALKEAYHRARRPVDGVLFPVDEVVSTRGADLLVMLNGTVAQPATLRMTARKQAELRSCLTRENDAVVAILRRGQALFLGFGLRDPLLYALHALLRRSADPSTDRSVVVSNEDWPALRQAWEEEFAILQESTPQLLQELQRRYQDYLDETMKIWNGPEVLDEARAGRPLTNKRMSGMILPVESKLEGTTLDGCELYGATLKRVSFRKCQMVGTDLGGANLEGAQLIDCNAERVVLVNADLTGAHLDGARLVHADLTGAVLDDTTITGTQFDQTEASLMDLTGAQGTAPSFADGNLAQAEFVRAELTNPVFRDSLLWGCDFSGAKLPGADFRLANLSKASFRGTILTGARFFFANLQGADFTGADVDGADFTRTLLDGAKLSGALNVHKAKFERAVPGTAELPSELRRSLELAQTSGSGGTAPVAPELDDVATGRYLLVMGPGLSMGPDYMAKGEELARQLARDCDWRNLPLELADVAQYYAGRHGRARLLLRMKEWWREENLHPDTDSLDLATSLPFDIILTTALDDQLHKAYQTAHRPYTIMPALSARQRREPGQDLLVCLCGSVGVPLAPLTITRQDLFALEARLARPDNPLAPYLRDRVLLFLGFDLRDPLLFTLSTLLRQQGAASPRSYVARDTPETPLASAWEYAGLLSCSSRELLEEFQLRWLQGSVQERRILSKDEMLERLHDGLPLAGKRLMGVELPEGFDLSGARDMTGCRLTSAKLAKVTLTGVRLDRADLSQADLAEAHLEDCGLLGARLSAVMAKGVDLSRAHLDQAILPKADLEKAKIHGASFVEAEMFWAKLNDAEGKGADFARAKLPSAVLSDAKLPGANFRDCFATGAILQRAELQKADFQMANLAGAKFESAHLEGAVFRRANLSGADFTKAYLEGAIFDETRLDETDFSGAYDAEKASFAGASWRRAKLPKKLRQLLEQSETSNDANKT